MRRLLQALSDMPIVKLKGDRDPLQVGARRGVIACLCAVIEDTRPEGARPTGGRRLFTRDEGIALGALFVLAMREVGMQDVVASSEVLAGELHDRLQRGPVDAARCEEPTEAELIDGAEQLSNRIVSQLEYATRELW